MAELLSPGIFIQERTSQQQQINAVSTSNFATVGWTPRGPENEATLITSLEQFFNTFGAYSKYSDLPYGIVGFFQNGGARAYVVRVAPNDSLYASGDIATNWKFTAKSRGAWGNLVYVVITGNENYYDAATATYSKFDVNIFEETTEGAGDYEIKESFTELNLTDEDDASYILTVINAVNTGSDLVVASILSGGIPTALQSTAISNESIATGDSSTQLFTHTLTQVPVGADSISIKVAGVTVASDDGSGNFDTVSGAGVTGTIDYDTGSMTLFFVAAPASGEAITVDYYKGPEANVSVDLTGGSDGTPENIGRSQISASSLSATKKGIYAFNNLDEILNIGLMDFSADKTISLDLIAYCEARKDCFAILDTGTGLTAEQAKRYKRTVLNSVSDYAAIYWPRIKVADELKNGVPKTVSPVGHVMGCYARTDIEKNVGKTPAGVDDGQLLGIIELEYKGISQGERDILYPIAVNPLREDAFVGRAVWGGKTLAITGDFTRINARRLFMFLEKSIGNSLFDIVFENLGAQLFSKVKLRIDGFLQVLFEDGYFRGETPEQAYRVIVDESNNSTESINARRLVIDVLISVNEPGEFLLLRMSRSFPE
jgi:hypothetical protein